MSSSLKLWALLVAFVAVSVSAQENYVAPAGSAYSAPAYSGPVDKKPSYANGRVKIQVYRGPNKENGKGYEKGYDGAFAPWGFYVTQPEDNKGYGRR